MLLKARLVVMQTVCRTTVPLLLAGLCATAANAGVFSGPAAQMGAIDNPGTIPIGVPALSVANAPTTFGELEFAGDKP